MAFTQSGSTARRISKYRPKMPILAITPSTLVYGRLLLSWGVQVCLVAASSSVDELFATGAQLCKDLGLARSGDLFEGLDARLEIFFCGVAESQRPRGQPIQERVVPGHLSQGRAR